MEDKEDFLEIIVNALKEVVSSNPLAKKQYSSLLLTIRFMIEWRLNYEGKVFGLKDRDTQVMMRMHLCYLSQLKFDDFYHWTQ